MSSTPHQPSLKECLKTTQNALKTAERTFVSVLGAVEHQENMFSALQTQFDDLREKIRKNSPDKIMHEKDVIDEQSGKTWANLKEAIRRSRITKSRKSNMENNTKNAYISSSSSSSSSKEQTKEAESPKFIILSSSYESSENKKNFSPSKSCPHCGERIHSACRKCPHCGNVSLKQDKRSKADRKRREHKRRKNNIKKLKLTERV